MKRTRSTFDTWLNSRNLTRKDIANLLGKSEQSICYKVIGKTNWDVSELRAIKKAYNMSDEEFFVVFNIESSRLDMESNE